MIFQEIQQTDLNSDFDGIFSNIGQSEGISFNVNYVQLDRNQPDQSFGNCELSWKHSANQMNTVELKVLISFDL